MGGPEDGEPYPTPNLSIEPGTHTKDPRALGNSLKATALE